MLSHRIKTYDLDVKSPPERLVDEQRRTNLLLELQCDLLIKLLIQDADGWCDTSAESHRLDKIMEHAS